MATNQQLQVRAGLPDPAVVEANLARHRERHEHAVSFDSTDPANEMLAVRCATDPGIPASMRDGWRGIVVSWWIGPYNYENEETGEVAVLPSLVLIDHKDSLVRLTGWPAISAWSGIMCAVSSERRSKGIPVVIRRRPSGTAGRSYWTVVVDPSVQA